MPAELQDILGRYLQRSHYSVGQLAARSGVPKRTIINWQTGRVSKPHHWQGLVQIAAALNLDEMETNELLNAADHPPLATLRETAAPAAQPLLAPWPATAAPFQAIPALPYFVGRQELIHQLTTQLLAGQPTATCQLHGMGGAGKTSLAAYLAYHLRPHFPDGVLWARLDASDTLTILSHFAAAYGEDVSPHTEIESRASAVRAILAPKRFLMVLDNAENSGQIRPLLPASTGYAAVLVTSRQELSALDGFPRFNLESFSPASGDSRALFSRLIGPARAQEWQTLLLTLADLLGHLPLALAIAGGQLHGRTQRHAQNYVEHLQQTAAPLDALTRDDQSVRLTFAASYRTLPPALRHFLADLGALGRADFSTTAAAAVADVPLPTAEQYLTTLLQRSLVQPAIAGRYVLHPLLHTYAREQMTNDQPQRRMVTFFAQYADENTGNREQLVAELAHIIHALQTAQETPLPDEFMRALLAITPIWQAQGDLPTAAIYMETAYHAQWGTPAQQAQNLAGLGRNHWYLGQPEQSQQYHEAGLALATEIGHDALQSSFLINLGTIQGYNYGRYAEAEAYLQRALPHARAAAHTGNMVHCLNALGNTAYEQGRWSQAADYWREGLTLVGEDQPVTLHIVRNLGVFALSQGHFGEADHYLQRAIQIARTLQYQELMSTALSELGRLYILQGQLSVAKLKLEEALAIGRKINQPEAIALALINTSILELAQHNYDTSAALLAEAGQLTQEASIAWLTVNVLCQQGELALAQGAWAMAYDYLTQAIEQAQAQGMPEIEGVSLLLLARTTAALNQPGHAQTYAEQSLNILGPLQHLQAAEVRDFLADLSTTPPSPNPHQT